MAELKTKENDASVTDFIDSASEGVKREDSYKLLEMFEKITKEKPKMWGTSIIGFGKYHYKSERSRQEGDWPLTGFSPRKQNLTLYIHPMYSDRKEFEKLLSKLGKHKMGGGCLYINKLADVDESVLKQIIKKSFEDMKKEHSK